MSPTVHQTRPFLQTSHAALLRDLSANLAECCFGKRKPWGSLDIFVLRVALLAIGLTSGRFSSRLS